MKKNWNLTLVGIATLLAASCSAGDDYLDNINNYMQDNGYRPNGNSSSIIADSADNLGDLTIAVDSAAIEESETIPADNEDYLENNTFNNEIRIHFNNAEASVTGSVAGVSVTVNGADVTVQSTAKGVNYILSGTTSDGMFKMADGDNSKKFLLTLNGVNIKNTDGPAINIQTGKRCYVNVADGTINTLTDGTSYASSDEDQKATLFSEGELLFSGKGRLRIYANTKNGICSDDYIMFRPGGNIYVKATASNCIKSNDGILIKGGVINCETSATASKGFKTDGFFQMDGGKVTAITSGNGEYDSEEQDVNASAGVKADSIITINGGELLCKSSGTGGKGISTDQQFVMNDGTVKVITSGSTYSYYRNLDSKAKGIKSDGDMIINGGALMVRATGGDGSEGIESKGVMTVNAGQIEVYSYDDCLNSASHMYIKGGYIYACSINNDGLDANGNMYIEGGTTIAYGSSQPECGIDANEERGYSVIVTGGTLVGIGGGTSYPSSNSTQPSIVFNGNVTSGTTLALNGSSNILALTMNRSYNGSACFLITSPSLKKGSSYALYTGSTISGTDWHGLVSNATVSSEGTSVATVSSLVSPYSSCGNATGGMGGKMSGGWH